ncbi:MAG: 3'-5' exonuclease [Prevotella sp.]|nr:3'-5' exonuclease [Candidatus Prevotella equi]
MKLNLTKPLIIFDLETTGLDIARDSIIQISYIKVGVDGSEKRQNYFINPGKPIPQEVQELTHITNEMVKDAPTFKQLAPELAAEFKDCDFAGYNSNYYDIPLLAEEFLRAGVSFDFTQSRMIDACTIFKQMEKRNLAAAYKFYCGRKMEDDFQAHLADQDTEATYRVLQGQLDMYAPGKQEEEDRQLPNDMDALHTISNPRKNVDFAGRMVWGPLLGPNREPLLNPDGTERMIEYFNFGKYKGWTVRDVLNRDPGYFSWMLSGDFTLETKQALTRIRLREQHFTR